MFADGTGKNAPWMWLKALTVFDSKWSWDRLPVGRPKIIKYEDWDDKHDPLRCPTWAYKWDVLNETTDDPSVMYKLYQSELDAITPEQVNRHCISDYHASIVT